MTPVVNPWFFYWMDVAYTLSCVATIGAAVFGFTFVVNLACKIDADADFLPDAYAKVCGFIAVVCLVLAVLIPTKKTMMQMAVAQNVTYERVETATDTVKEVYEDIIELFDKEE